MSADDLWGRDRSRAYFDVSVVCPFAQSHRNTSMSQCYRKNELEKKRCYEQRIREIEHGSFSPLVFSTSGGMGPTATTVYKRIASMMAQKQDKPYSRSLHWIRCKLSYSLLRSAYAPLYFVLIFMFYFFSTSDRHTAHARTLFEFCYVFSAVCFWSR